MEWIGVITLRSEQQRMVHMRKQLPKFIVTGLLFLIVLSAASPSHSAAHFTRVATFGDSLTHNDILRFYSKKPQGMYGKDPLEAVFKKGRASGDKLRNFAIAGSVAMDSGDDDSPTMEYQVDEYELLLFIGVQKEASFVSFEIGSNDILDDIEILANPDDPRGARRIDKLIAAIEDSWLRLRDLLPDAQFLIWTIPDVTLTPKLTYLTHEEAESVRAHIERVNLFISGLVEERRVLVFDLYAVMQQLVAAPPVVGGQRLVGPPSHGHYNDLFADKIHPTAVSNALIANEMIKRVNDFFEDDIPLYTNRELAALARSRRR